MPITVHRVLEIPTRITIPIVNQIAESILRTLGVRSMFDNQNIVINVPNMTESTPVDNLTGQVNITRDKCVIDVTTSYNPDNAHWDTSKPLHFLAYGLSAQYASNYTQIFEDPVAQFRISEVTVPCSINMEFDLQFKNYDDAMIAFTSFVGRYHKEVTNNAHDIVFSYPMSGDVLRVMQAVFNNRKTSGCADLVTYVNKFQKTDIAFDTRRDDIGNAHPEQQMVVRRIQLNCECTTNMTIDGPEAVMQDKVADLWSVKFTYIIQFGRPNTLLLQFPCVVENQLLPIGFFQSEVKNMVLDIPRVLINNTFDELSKNQVFKAQPAIMLRSPTFDDWMPPLNIPLYSQFAFKPILVNAFTIDSPANTVLDLTNIPGVTYDPVMLKILLAEAANGSDIFSMSSFFNISVFANDYLLDPQYVSISPDLKLTITAMDTTKRYHLVISESMNYVFLNQKWLPWFMAYRHFFPMTIMRNLNLMVQWGIYTIVPSIPLVDAILILIKRGLLRRYVDMLIDAGNCTPLIYQYTMTALQFADYISNTEALNSSQDLYDCLMVMLANDGLIDINNAPPRYLSTPKGFPITTMFGGSSYAFNLPLRVVDSTIAVSRSRNPSHGR